MKLTTTRCTLCTGTTHIRSITRPGTTNTYPICSSCDLLIYTRASTEEITYWHAFTLMLKRLDKHLGRGVHLANTL